MLIKDDDPFTVEYDQNTIEEVMGEVIKAAQDKPEVATKVEPLDMDAVEAVADAVDETIARSLPSGGYGHALNEHSLPPTGGGWTMDIESPLNFVLGAGSLGETLMLSGEFPILRSLYRKYKAAEPPVRTVQVDTDETYQEPVVVGAVDDGEPGSDLSRLEDEAEGKEPISLSFDPALGDVGKKVKCYREGEKIVCSMRVMGPDGRVRIVTVVSPVADHVEEMVGYSLDANLNPVEVLGMLPGMVTVLGAGSLITQMASSMRDILAMPGVAGQTQTVYGSMSPDGRPDLAAVVELKRLAKAGDKGAKDEVKKLTAKPEALALVAEADERILSEKSRK